MGKYDRLGAWLRENGARRIPMTFDEIEKVIGVALPKSQNHQAWWSNSTSNNVMTQVWLDAGYRTEQVDIAGRRLVFRRADPPDNQGVGEGPRMFKPAEPQFPPLGTKVARHPASGAMKGTFWVDPNWDLTQPALDPEDLAQWEAKLDRIADEMEAYQKVRQGKDGAK